MNTGDYLLFAYLACGLMVGLIFCHQMKRDDPVEDWSCYLLALNPILLLLWPTVAIEMVENWIENRNDTANMKEN